MNGLSDALTIGIVITLVFGALFFYLYSRLAQNEKRVSLIENILLDLKMSADAGWGVHGVQHDMGEDEQPTPVNHVEPISAPEPLASDDVDTTEESMYKDILAQTSAPDVSLAQDEVKSFDVNTSMKIASPKATVQVTKVQANYEAMSNKELKSLAKQKGISVPSQAGKKGIIAALRKADGGASSSTPAPSSTVEPGSFLGSQEGSSLDGEPLGEVETL
jgi:hypothetical protein